MCIKLTIFTASVCLFAVGCSPGASQRAMERDVADFNREVSRFERKAQRVNSIHVCPNQKQSTDVSYQYEFDNQGFETSGKARTRIQC